jgi:opacity protein-like surface antigen
MPYVTGGAAFGKVKLSSPAAGGVPGISESHTAFGWAAGAGVEYGFTDHLTAKLEYLHVDLGTGAGHALAQSGGGSGAFTRTIAKWHQTGDPCDKDASWKRGRSWGGYSHTGHMVAFWPAS